MSLPSATRPIVVGVGFDDEGASLGHGSSLCLSTAATLARRTRANLEIVHAVEVPLSATGRDLLLQRRQHLCASGVRARVTFDPGARTQALCSVALGRDAGLIVVGGTLEVARELCADLRECSSWPVLAICWGEDGLVLLADRETRTAQACARLVGAPTQLLSAG